MQKDLNMNGEKKNCGQHAKRQLKWKVVSF